MVEGGAAGPLGAGAAGPRGAEAVAGCIKNTLNYIVGIHCFTPMYTIDVVTVHYCSLLSVHYSPLLPTKLMYSTVTSFYLDPLMTNKLTFIILVVSVSSSSLELQSESNNSSSGENIKIITGHYRQFQTLNCHHLLTN